MYSLFWRTVSLLFTLLVITGTARAENYAVLFAGGNGSGDNEPRYYEQISHHYHVLKDNLGYKPENIWILFADGLDPAADQSDGTNSNWYTHASQGAHVMMGNEAELNEVLEGFQNLDPHDMFYFYCFDHGSGTQDDKDDHDEEQITAWSGSDINDEEFAASTALVGAERQVYVLGQCYSGGILEELDMSGDWKFGCASCTHFEKSYSYGYDGLNECWSDAITEQGRHTTYSVYATARDDMGTYSDPDYVFWGGEGPGSPIPYQMEGVTHPWKRGSNIDISIARWRGSGTAYGGTEDYSLSSNWNHYYGYPNTQTILIEFTEPGRALLDDSASPYFVIVDYDYSLAGSAEFEIAPSGYLQPLHSLVVGDTKYGKLLQSGGECRPSSLLLGAKSPSYGVYEMQGGLLQTSIASEVVIGKRGYGLFIQDAGTVTIDSSAGYIRFGEESGSTGIYQISGDAAVTMTAKGLSLGINGSGTFTQNGGTVNIEENIYLGDQLDSEGSYNMSGGTLACATIAIRDGEFIHSGGTVTASQGVGLASGNEPGQSGRYELSDSAVLNAYALTVGTPQNGTFVQSGGTCAVNKAVTVGKGDNSQGLYELSNGILTGENLRVGYTGYGVFTQSGGAATFNDNIDIGYEVASLGVLTINDGTMAADTLRVGRWGTGRLTQTGGTVTLNEDISLGLESGSNGTLEMQGGLLDARDHNIHVGLGGNGTLALDDGYLYADTVNVGPNGQLISNIGNGTLRLNTLNLSNDLENTVGYLEVGHTVPLAVVVIDANQKLNVMTNLKVGHSSPAAFGQNENSEVTIGSNLYVGHGTGGESVYSMIQSMAQLSANNEYIGYGANGSFNQSAGRNIVTHDMNLGALAGVHGNYTLSGTGYLNALNIYVGMLGTGTFDQTGGIAHIDTLYVGLLNDGTYTLSNGNLVITNLEIAGGGGTGLFDWTNGYLAVDTVTIGTGGTMNVTRDWTFDGALNVSGGEFNMGEYMLNLGAFATPATLNISGGSFGVNSFIAGDGYNKKATITHTDGTLTIAYELKLGYPLDSEGTYTITNGKLDVSDGTIYIGDQGDGILNINGGLVVADQLVFSNSGILTGSGNGILRVNALQNMPDDFSFGSNLELGHGTWPSPCWYSMNNDQSITIGGDLTVGKEAGATFNQSAASTIVNITGNLRIGSDDGVVGTYSLNDSTAQLMVGRMDIGVLGEGEFQQISGTCTITNDLILGTLRLGSKIGTGTYNMDGGTLMAPNQGIGLTGNGTFTQNGGDNISSELISIGETVLGIGQYYLNYGTIQANNIYVGREGTGTFSQYGGDNTVTGSLIISQEFGSHGVYNLEYGSLNAQTLRIGNGSGTDGEFNFASGTLTAANIHVQGGGAMNVTNLWEFEGEMEVSGGTLYVSDFNLGSYATGLLNWTSGTFIASNVAVNANGTMNVDVDWSFNGNLYINGGTFDISENLFALGTIGTHMGADDTGYIEITDGTLTAGNLSLGYGGKGFVMQNGGTVNGNTLSIGNQGIGNYNYNNGTLAMNTIIVNPMGTLNINTDWTCGSTLNVTGGLVNAEESSLTFEGSGGTAHAVISGGEFRTSDLNIGITQQGRLAITDAQANVTVSNLLRIGPYGEFSAVPGATITMTGSNFQNESTDPTKLADLDKLDMLFKGGPSVLDSFEVAGKDLGPTMDACVDNFALGGLLLNDYPEGRVQLNDFYDNQPLWTGTEALYVHRLAVKGGSQLDLNGHNLYYLSAVFDPDAMIYENGGSLIQISIPDVGAELLGVPAPHAVAVTPNQSSNIDRGTLGMMVPGDEGEMIALSSTFEIDTDALNYALYDSGADYFSLVMYYNELELEILGILEDTLRPYWWNDTQWVLGGTQTNGEEGEGIFMGFDTNPGDYGLGYCGLNTETNFLWVNLNHASDYGAGGLAIPEPAALSLLVIGGLALIRRKK